MADVDQAPAEDVGVETLERVHCLADVGRIDHGVAGEDADVPTARGSDAGIECGGSDARRIRDYAEVR